MASWTDDFNRADNTSLGANWTEDEGSIDIVTNKADAVTAASFNRARYTGVAFDSSNHYVQAVGGANGGTDRIGICCRQASSANTCYQLAWVAAEAGGLKLRSLSAGTETEIGSATLTGTADHTFKVQADGSTISGWVDGTSVISVTNTAIATGLYGGMHIYGNNGLWDDAAGADLVAATGQGHLLSNKRNRSIQ